LFIFEFLNSFDIFNKFMKYVVYFYTAVFFIVILSYFFMNFIVKSKDFIELDIELKGGILRI